MKPLKQALAVLAILVGGGLGLAAQQAERVPPAESQSQETPRPATPAPKDAPPPPPALRPDPPASVPAPREKSDAGGQWVHTEQYGWVWMPYGNGFTHVPPEGGTPSMYVYYPESGWCWVVAPWLWGWGPRPYFGIYGPRYYAWWGVGLGHWYGFSGYYGRAGSMGRGYWGGGRWNGVIHYGTGGHPGGSHPAAPGPRSGRRDLSPGWRR